MTFNYLHLTMIKKDILNRWNKLKASGDIKELANLTQYSEATISRVMGGKQKASLFLLLEINRFYAKRKKQLDNL